MHFVRAKRIVISTVALCFALAPLASARQGAVTIGLKDALRRARDNSQQLQSAAIGVEIAGEDRTQARSALLPSLNYFNQYIYTQGNGAESGIFVGNDGVHVYSSQAQLHQELFSPERLMEYRRTVAAQSLAAARRDIVERGLVATVAQGYYEAVTAQRRSANAQKALEEARRFVDVTTKLEQGGEVAHSDTLKAQLVLQQRLRDVQETRLAGERAKIALSVLLFPDYRLDFNLVDDLDTIGSLPAYPEIESRAREKNPELRAAEESVHQEEYGVKIAKAGYLPSLNFDYFFGINANHFAAHDPDGVNRLGSVAQATLNLPVWDWWTTRSKVRQADMRRRQAQLDLELSRKLLTSTLHSLYLEAQTSLAQLDSLRQTVDAAMESLRLVNLRYEAGEVTVLEVVDAQSTLAEARNAYDEGLSRYHLALAAIQTLTGTI